MNNRLFDIIGLVILVSVLYVGLKKFIAGMIPIVMAIITFGVMAYIVIMVSTIMVTTINEQPVTYVADGPACSVFGLGMMIIVTGFICIIIGAMFCYDGGTCQSI